ncbi:hypothetical protein ASPTUDRAFT_77300 [Aspergillus tubingensis CBS 134.48]|uniref:Uncharacterized protein n=1 Tax=Aspergillus tubingensis (strain CBS 134.48) TaxID=767770 RepID=A0A1L9MYH1_ASPTC|nr:hypothetical protein ASPTUDRAFT_77300 [Aspergillus tubingensis CBS 134.48]
MRMKERLVERCWGGASFSHMSRCFCACPCQKQGQPVALWAGRKRVSNGVASGVVLRRFLSLSHVFPCVSSQLLASVIYILRGGKCCFMQHATEPVPTDSLPNRELYISQSGTMM